MDKSKRPAGKGHNSEIESVELTDSATALRLKSFIERIEKLEDERDGISLDIKDVYAEAKSIGFCQKTIKRCIKQRKQDVEKLKEESMLFDTYRSALQMELF